MKLLNAIIITVFIILLGIFLYKVYEILPQEKQNLFIKNPSPNELPNANLTNTGLMFLPNMRMQDGNVSYYFINGCADDKKSRVLQAFKILEDQTGILDFQELSSYNVNKKPEITIYCYGLTKDIGNNSFIAGEGGPGEVVNSSVYPLIVSGEVYLYDEVYKANCNQPLVELHEILHALGFNHVDNKSSVMYPYISCGQSLSDNIVSQIKTIYSIPPKAELIIESINSSKGGIYLNFEAKINNKGILSADNVNLTLYDADKNSEITSFKLNVIGIGTSKTLSIQNLILPSRNINKIKFVVTSDSSEYSTTNNEATAELQN